MKEYRNSEQTARTVESPYLFIHYKFILKSMEPLFKSYIADTLIKAVIVLFFNTFFSVLIGYVRFSFF